MNIESNFKEQISTIIIPSIEGMIEKEKEHLLKLTTFYNESKNQKNQEGILLAKKFIRTSKRWLEHFELRLIEYKKYAKQDKTCTFMGSSARGI